MNAPRKWIAMTTGVAIGLGGSSAAEPTQSTTNDMSASTPRECSDIGIATEVELPELRQGQERGSFPAPQSGALELIADRDSGLSVEGSDESTVDYLLCKTAWASDGATAEAMLAEIGVTLDGERLSVRGPERSSQATWTAHLVARVPRRARLTAATSHGGLQIAGLEGPVVAVSEHGGIRAEAAAGGMDLRSLNGSVTLSLRQPEWPGERIDLHSRNGSVHLALPQGSQTPIAARTRFGQLRCSGLECRPEGGDRDDRRWRIGSDGEPEVRLSTVNGTLSVVAR